MKMMKSVYHYNDHIKFLKDYYQFKKKSNIGFTYCQFSKLADIKSPNYLKLIIDGDRELTIDKIFSFAKALELDRDEKHYFEALVLYNQAASSELKRYYQQKIKNILIEKTSDKVDISISSIISRWYYPALILNLHEKREDYDLSKITRSFKISKEEVNRNVKMLLENGVLTIKDGQYRMSNEHVYYRDKKKFNMIRQNFLREQLNLSRDVFDKKYRNLKNDNKDRFFSHTFTVSREGWDEYVEIINAFIEKATKLSNSEIPEITAQLNIQFFKII